PSAFRGRPSTFPDWLEVRLSHAQLLAREIQVRPVAFEGGHDALGAEPPHARPIALRDAARPERFAFARVGEHALLLRPPLALPHQPRRRGLSQARGLLSRGAELLLELLREHGAGALETGLAFREHACAPLGQPAPLRFEAVALAPRLLPLALEFAF